jgi:hypothetical protein
MRDYCEPVDSAQTSIRATSRTSATSLVERYDKAPLLSIKWRSRAELHSAAS